MTIVLYDHSFSEDFLVQWIGPEGEEKGPLYVLWQLIESYQVDIFEVSLTKITEDFLNYIQNSNIFKLEVASSFIEIASRLLYYKSKALLPDPGFEEEEQDTLPKEIIQQLLEYRKFQKAAEALEQIEEVSLGIFGRETFDLVISEFEERYNLNSLIQAYLRLLKRKLIQEYKTKDFLEIEIETITLEDKIQYIRGLIHKKQAIEFFEILEKKDFLFLLEVVVSFLAILELARQKVIVIEQKQSFGPIFIFKKMVTVQ
ncbi:MAG: segregation and condensation protein A [Leptonema sp. (in: bacteria)]